MYGLVFANGDPNDGPAVTKALASPEPRFIIAADGGLRIAIHFGLRPDLVIGDMDSVDPIALAQAEAQGSEIVRFPAEKNETDLELALLAAAKHGCNPIWVVGASGDRLDQTLGNVYLLTLPELRDHDVRLVSHAQATWLIYPGTMTVTGQPGDTLSLIPLNGNIRNITTEGLKYPLQHEVLTFGPARGMSNVLTKPEARVSFDDGVLLAIHTVGRA
ncbi:MAG: thiamine diphosphokinase [Chloroflexota bacterium]